MVVEGFQGNGVGRRFFFVHVMKTGGTTFVQHINRNFQPHEIFPGPEPGPVRREAYFLIDRLRTLTPERQQAIRIYAGHFPYVATKLVGTGVVTLTVLRDPIDRTVSVLRHCKRYFERFRDHDLEQIYEDGFIFSFWIRDHQAKLFSLTAEDEPASHLDVLEVDAGRLELAKANLQQVDVLGLSDRFDEFTEEMRLRFGWRVDAVDNREVSREGWNVTPEFRKRIAADNAADLEFYEYARSVHLHRRSG